MGARKSGDDDGGGGGSRWGVEWAGDFWAINLEAYDVPEGFEEAQPVKGLELDHMGHRVHHLELGQIVAQVALLPAEGGAGAERDTQRARKVCDE